MCANFTPVGGGGADNITKETETDPTPTANEVWLQLLGREGYGYDAASVTSVTENTDPAYSSSEYLWDVSPRDGVYYLGDSDGNVKAIDTSDGTTIWTNSDFVSSVYSVYEEKDVVYAGGQPGSVRAINASDGTTKWTHFYHGSTANGVDREGDIVVSGGNDERVIAVDASDKSLIWSKQYHTYGINAVFIQNGYVYSGSGGKLIVQDASDGSLLYDWDVHQGTAPQGIDVQNRVIYSGGIDDRIVATDVTDGSIIWSHQLQDNINDIHYSNGVVYSADTGNNVTAYDPETDTELWSHTLHGDTVQSVNEWNGTVFSTGNTEVVAVDLDGITSSDITSEFKPSGYKIYTSNGNMWTEVQE